MARLIVSDPWHIREAVVLYYRQSWRRYHNWAHIMRVRASIDWDQAENPDALELAVLCHDAIYVPGSHLNEEASGLLAMTFALPYSPEASRLVRLTKQHEPDPGDTDGILLCNADLWGLGDPPKAYADTGTRIHDEVSAYIEAMGLEWSDWSRLTWPEARAQWLRGFLARQYIYRGDDEIYRDREAQARRNMANELEGLENAPRP